MFPADVDSTISEAEGRALAELARDRIVLELGAWLGRSTVCMGQTAAQLVSVDWHRGDEHAGNRSTLPGFVQSLDRYGLAGITASERGLLHGAALAAAELPEPEEGAAPPGAYTCC